MKKSKETNGKEPKMTLGEQFRKNKEDEDNDRKEMIRKALYILKEYIREEIQEKYRTKSFEFNFREFGLLNTVLRKDFEISEIATIQNLLEVYFRSNDPILDDFKEWLKKEELKLGNYQSQIVIY